MTAQHTPGPWELKPNGLTTGFDILAPADQHGTRLVVARYVRAEDAPILLAAPDVLAALRDMIDWLDDGNRVLSDACAADVMKARAAVAKATGSAS